MLLHLLIILLFVISFKKILLKPPLKSEQSITLNLNKFQSPTSKSLPIKDTPKEEENIESPTEELPEKQVNIIKNPPVLPSLDMDNNRELQEMTRRLLEKIAKIEAYEVNTTKISEEERIVVIEKPIVKPKKTIIKEIPKVEPIKKEVIKKEPIEKKIEKPKKTFEMIIKNPIKVKETKKEKKVEKKKKRKKKKIIKKRKKYKSKDPLASAIMDISTSRQKYKSDKSAMRMIKQFYGSEFNSFTKTQKRFIENNLGSIYQITQGTLSRNGYPHVALNTRQQGTAIVTFYLHPNGDISGLRLKKRIGYASLDKNTLKVIRIAYKDYPRPKTKTKITFYVEYSLF